MLVENIWYICFFGPISKTLFPTSGEFRVYEDTQLVQQDLSPGVHVYVHYFTLYDVRARGFVRPMCLSYISGDHHKLLHYFSRLKQKFTAVSIIIDVFCFVLNHLVHQNKRMKDYCKNWGLTNGSWNAGSG